MIDADIRNLLERGPDRALDQLESEVWAEVVQRQREQARTRRLLAVQGVVLAAVLTGSVLAGRVLGGRDDTGLDVFSPRMSLSAANLLIGGAR